MNERTYAPWYRYKGQTSDDTRTLELRPKKRPSQVPFVPDRDSVMIKKLRLDSAPTVNK
ncbi:hypothetical protein RhiirC2_746128 [Rhizophagus irregularis]|uniref:Uncharacterized protein n=1 Tax=Rhizophagus irregularis TaxID=588596 RepID=A0A2N1N9K8_9GLOM|nr:hypothetical protein RhiirC2_746128 [Rhizophagus irregularis]